MKTLGYYNGRYDEIDNMMIPMNDRVCFFGDGVYDVAMARDYRIFALDEHIDRFFRSASMLDMKVPCTKEALKDLLYEMAAKLDQGDMMVYWQLTRATAPRSHIYDRGVPSNLWIMLRPMALSRGTGGMKLSSMEDIRFLWCNIKTLNLIPAVMAAQKAEDEGCGECVLHRGERVTECAHSNISILKDGVLRTAPCDNLILPGVARAHLIAICRKLGIGVDETPFTMEELKNADEILVTSTTKLCKQAYWLDGAPVGGKAAELADKIMDAVWGEFRAVS